jgi:hypothetical protein
MGSKYTYEKPIYESLPKVKVTNATKRGTLTVTKESTMEMVR